MIWKEQKMLILADLHLGKITHFRKQGIPLPKEVEKDNFDRFSYLILNHNVDSILILGDLFHSEYNSEWEAFLTFLSRFPNKKFILVKGNHDILGASNYITDNLEVHKECYINGPFHFTHHPEDHNLYNVCGHIHPAVKLKGKGLQRLRLPCFFFGLNQAIIPAFGSFTGTYTLEPQKEDQVYVVASERVIKVV
mgnify:CR=1 FL=1